MFSKVLIANRGEIALRVIRTLKELGIATVAVYSEADADAPHVRHADEAYEIGPAPAAESYLRADKILDVAVSAGVDAIHPGYGFLAENASFARACADAGVVFIGPPPEAIEAMGSKIRARETMRAAGVPIVPGTTAPVESLDAAAAAAEEIGYPVAMKAAGGGGGKGFRVAHAPEEIEKAFAGASGEGERFFGDPTVYVERYLEDPRHVEVQILADGHGNVVHLGERDCSIQRRHQKLIEECPAPGISAELRERIASIGVEAARAVGYRGAGTVEGLLADGEYYFLEMNTRVQVEHSVTEMATGIDIVREQILIAAGEPLSFAQEDVELRGHAIECRINAEDASKNFAPAPGAHRPLPRAGRPVRAGRLRRRGRRGRAPVLRPDDREADRLGSRPRGRHPAHAAGARRVRDRGPEDPAPVPPRAAADRSVGGGLDLPRPDRRPRLAQGAGAGPGRLRISRVASPRRGAGVRTLAGCVAQLDRRAELRRAVELDHHPAMAQLRVLDRLAEIVDRADAGVAAVEQREPLVAGLASGTARATSRAPRVELGRDRSGRPTPSHSSRQNGGSSAPTVRWRPSAHS